MIFPNTHVKNGHYKDTCYDELVLCAQNNRHYCRFSCQCNLEGLCNHLKRIMIDSLWLL